MRCRTTEVFGASRGASGESPSDPGRGRRISSLPPFGRGAGGRGCGGVVECGASSKGRQRGDPPPAALAPPPLRPWISSGGTLGWRLRSELSVEVATALRTHGSGVPANVGGSISLESSRRKAEVLRLRSLGPSHRGTSRKRIQHSRSPQATAGAAALFRWRNPRCPAAPEPSGLVSRTRFMVCPGLAGGWETGRPGPS